MAAAPLAIISGAGSFPLEVAEAAARSGRAIHMVGIAGAADPAIERYPHVWIKFGELGKLYRQLDTWSCRDLVIVGAVTRPHPSEIRFDLGALASVPDLTRLLRGGDDGVLGGVVRFFEGRGYHVASVLEVAPDLAAPQGQLGAITADPEAREAISYGSSLLAALAPFDVGQGAVVLGGRAVAIEGIEGTDSMLERVAELRTNGRLRAKGRAGVLVKLPKRGQSLKVDLPTIGTRTVEKAATAGLAGIAVAAGHVLLAERQALLKAADAAGLFIIGVPWTPDGGPRGIRTS
jgi:DUF1009 family protein